MKKFVVFAFLTILICYVFGWSAHETLTYLIVQSLPNKDDLVPITPYSYVESRVYNMEYLKLEDYCGDFIENFVPKWAVFFPPDPKPQDGKVPVWQILTIYSVEPDLGMDEGLQLSPLQDLIGSSKGVRHMKYRLLVVDFFEGSESVLYFINMSREAFKKGDRYWGYRFLARALHYLQDLSMPYHNAPGPLFDTVRGIFDKDTALMLAYTHFSYDEYMAYLLYRNDEETINAILHAEPKKVRNTRELIQRVRLLGLRNISKVHRLMTHHFGEDLKGRILGLEDFERKSTELQELKQITISIARDLSSLLKGFLLDYLKEVGEL
ncbi:phospholipase C/P1 nuclease family protein [Pseudothermotoga thermarum]|uniref:Phospholipase n=1 Tax=Pseudothermotoga thermarum DSM 5069 TaxID=688269 RepID=F7YXL4_9THEM|nr:hypothetical protein [Pseudothermotoga thermarum]AEH50655.1 hypothetical protein Theth_0566 [Pseudothermotoga thermarum DSM 5069]